MLRSDQKLYTVPPTNAYLLRKDSTCIQNQSDSSDFPKIQEFHALNLSEPEPGTGTLMNTQGPDLYSIEQGAQKVDF